MRIAFFVNDPLTEKASFTTTRMAKAANDREHDVFHIGAEGFAIDAAGRLAAHAQRGPSGAESLESYVERMQADDAEEEIVVGDLDVLMLRNNPSEEAQERPWAQVTGLIFGDLAISSGVIVLSHPGGLYKALNKLYLQAFPEVVRPRTLISRDEEDIRDFVRELGRAVLKPLQGFGGHNVFFVEDEDDENLAQMIVAIKRDGYVVAQEYLPGADDGDIRMILVNGEPLEVDGEYAAFRRVPAENEKRSNMAVGGEAERIEVDDDLLAVAEAVRPKLVADGMFLVGLDIVKNKLVELNVFSPGGLGSPHELSGVDFAPPVIERIERKVEMKKSHPDMTNREIAVL